MSELELTQFSATSHYIQVIRGDSPKIYSESVLFYKIKQCLNQRGFDLVKKCPAKDGGLTGAPYYLRDRRGDYCFYDTQYAIRDAAKAYSRGDSVKLYWGALKEGRKPDALQLFAAAIGGELKRGRIV